MLIGRLAATRGDSRRRSFPRSRTGEPPRITSRQPTLALSTCPTFVERHPDRAAPPRPPAFVLSGGEVKTCRRGLTRVALTEGSCRENSSQGGGTRDHLGGGPKCYRAVGDRLYWMSGSWRRAETWAASSANSNVLVCRRRQTQRKPNLTSLRLRSPHVAVFLRRGSRVSLPALIDFGLDEDIVELTCLSAARTSDTPCAGSPLEMWRRQARRGSTCAPSGAEPRPGADATRFFDWLRAASHLLGASIRHDPCAVRLSFLASLGTRRACRLRPARISSTSNTTSCTQGGRRRRRADTNQWNCAAAVGVELRDLCHHSTAPDPADQRGGAPGSGPVACALCSRLLGADGQALSRVQGQKISPPKRSRR